MKAILTIIIFVASLFIMSCSEDPTTPTGDFLVKGVVYQKNETVPNIPLQLKKNDEIVQETNSDKNGYFEFKNVAKDHYTLITKQTLDNGSFLEAPTDINVNGDLYLDNLILPKPVVLIEPMNTTTRSIELQWTPYTGNGFYEYKVYRHLSTALDETTGTLIHIATKPNDTTFVDEGQENGGSIGLQPNTTHYYRVYVNNEYGKMGGSNILETKTLQWDNEENFTVFYTLQPIKSFTTPVGIVFGLDSDGENIWILSVKSNGGYYTNNLVKIIEYDYKNDITLAEFEYNDEYIVPRSLMFADNYLWVYYDDLSGPWINKISPETGEIVNSFSCNTLQDMSYYNNYMYETRVASGGDIIRKIQLSDYGLEETFTFAIYDGLIEGIACRENEIWITARFSNQIVILDGSGNHIGVVESDNSNGGPGFYLCFVGDKLAYHKSGKIYIYDINSSP